MHASNYILNNKAMAYAAAAIMGAVILVAGLLTHTVNASGIIGVSSNITEVPGGETLVLTITAQNDGDVHELEVDHSFQGTYPEFSVYANEVDPYGGDQADFAALGVTVTYSAANSQWVIDFGPTITSGVTGDGGVIDFYFVLRDASRNILWGSMDTVTPENTFGFDLVEGTGDSLVPTVATEVVGVVPGVPNTAFGL